MSFRNKDIFLGPDGQLWGPTEPLINQSHNLGTTRRTCKSGPWRLGLVIVIGSVVRYASVMDEVQVVLWALGSKLREKYL